MMRLLDPASTIAVILGAHDWTRAGQPKALSFRRSAAQWHVYLLSAAPSGLGLQPDLVLNLFDDPSPASAQLVRIRDTIRGFVREREEMGIPIRDALIYYIGHGTGSGGHLHLLVRDTAEGIEEQSSIAASDLAQILRVAAPKQRRVIILDCCFSEAAVEAFGAMGSLDEAVATTALKDLAPGLAPPERGTLVLCSSPRKRASIGAPNAERTLFTGALLSVLAEGSVGRSDMISFGELREDIYERMLREYSGDPPRPALHQPDQQAGDLTCLPAFPNRAAERAERARRAAEEEDQQRKAAEEAQQLRIKEEEKQRREAEAAHRRAEEERRHAAEQARRVAEEEDRKRQAAEDAQRIRAKEEEEEKQQRQAEVTRQRAEEERRPHAAEQARRVAEEEDPHRGLDRAEEERRPRTRKLFALSAFLVCAAVLAAAALHQYNYYNKPTNQAYTAQQDNNETAKRYREAADQGDVHAQSNLGAIYANGQGVKQDYAEAAKWYRKAADQGDAHAQSNLGALYANGQGLRQDCVEAAKSYQLYADVRRRSCEAALGARRP